MRRSRLAKVVLYSLFGSCMLMPILCGAQEQEPSLPDSAPSGLPWDWSHERVIFSQTSDEQVLAAIQQDRRWFHQQWRRVQSTLAATTPDDSFFDEAVERNPPAAKRVARDWGANIGPASTITATNSTTAGPMYPAKYTLNINRTPSCTNDYAVLATGVGGTNAGGTPTPSVIAFNKLYSTQPTAGGYCNTIGPSVAWAYLNVLCAVSTTTSSDPILSSPVLSEDGEKVAWVTSTGKVQILTIGTVGNNGTSVSTAECVENAPGGTGTAPNNAVLNSVTLSNAKRNGGATSVSVSELYVDYNSDSAFIGDDDGYLHKITPFFNATGTLQDSITPSRQASHAYSVGALIVDSNGFIEECTTAGTSGSGAPVWNKTWGGTTTDSTVTWANLGSAGGWPVFVTGSSAHVDNVKLAMPIYDQVSKNIFIGDANGSLFYVLNPGTSTAVGTCANGLTSYPCVGSPGTASGITPAGGPQADCANATPNSTCMVMSSHSGFTDPITLDSTTGVVMLQFANADGTHAKVEQTNTSLSVFNSINVGPQVNLANHFGTFDNTYYTTPANGFYYFCGPDSTGKVTELYRVSFTDISGTVALGSITTSPLQIALANKLPNCTGLTEIYNTATSTDWLFLGLDGSGVTATCGGAPCVMSFKLGGSMVSAINASYAGPSNLRAFGGIIVDNVANTTTYPQASSIYFTPTANNLSCGDGSTHTVCAIKLTQAALQ